MLKFTEKQLKEIIKNLLHRFHNQFSMKPVIGLEIEFYTSDKKNIELIEQALTKAKLHYHLENETGENQYEIQLSPSMQILSKLDDCNKIKKIIMDISDSNFSAKPFADQPGNALHLHLNFLDKDHKNLFDKHGDQESPLLLQSVAGLLDTMPEAMYFLAPDENDYARYTPSIETPSNISWGNNNRTVAIRIPEKDSGARRIEHRVAAANTNPLAACAVIFAGALYGIEHKLLPPEKIYGNAYLPQYKLEPLPKDLQTSYNNLITGKKLLEIML